MSNFEVVINYDQVGKLLKGDECKAMLDTFGSVVAGRAGDGYGIRTHNADTRAICNVFPRTKEAWKDNLENNTLLRCL